ncbi:MAG: ATP-binding cassette domain-containing protein [Planctomycetia bacterium]
MIEVRGLAKTFRVAVKEPGLKGSLKALVRRRSVARHAVLPTTFRVEEGEIVGLVGPNGAGKTTLVKMLAGIVHPSAGDASVLGYRPWERKDAFRRQIALLMGQKAQLWWDLPASDGFALLRDIYGVPRALHAARLDELSSLLEVGGLLDTPVRRLSLGERMKMELVAALLHGPKVVFLDEPTIGLDLSAQRAVREFLLRYRERHRPAMVLTSHYMEDIERLCSRLLLLREGQLIYDGPLARVAEQAGDLKVVRAHLKPEGVPAPEALRALLAPLGEVLEGGPGQVAVRVPRTRVAEVASRLLQVLPVADLAIEAEEIGTLIERLLARRQEGAAP